MPWTERRSRPLWGQSLLREYFWAVLSAMETEERAKVLAFACGSGRLPAGGFGALHPRFVVEVLPNAGNELRTSAGGSNRDLSVRPRTAISP